MPNTYSLWWTVPLSASAEEENHWFTCVRPSGVFMAPVRGVYFFSFTAADYLKGYMGLYLYRNNQPIIFNLDLNDHGGYASTSNTVVLQLEGGDLVRLSLPASYRLYDDSRNFSVFSGFLLFSLWQESPRIRVGVRHPLNNKPSCQLSIRNIETALLFW